MFVDSDSFFKSQKIIAKKEKISYDDYHDEEEHKGERRKLWFWWDVTNHLFDIQLNIKKKKLGFFLAFDDTLGFVFALPTCWITMLFFFTFHFFHLFRGSTCRQLVLFLLHVLSLFSTSLPRFFYRFITSLLWGQNQPALAHVYPSKETCL